MEPEEGAEGTEIGEKEEGEEGAPLGLGGSLEGSQMTQSIDRMEGSLDMDDLGSLLSSLGLPGSVQVSIMVIH